jgi:hypothetical protein
MSLIWRMPSYEEQEIVPVERHDYAKAT